MILEVEQTEQAVTVSSPESKWNFNQLGSIMLRTAIDANGVDYKRLLEVIGEEAMANRLTQGMLNELLNTN
jgi:hypothetical protein